MTKITELLLPNNPLNTKHSHQKRQEFKKNTKIVYYWARNGGGGTFGCYCVRNGGGGRDTKKYFEKLIAFGVLHRSCQNAKNYQLFEKIFRVPLPPPPPPPPPPPVANPVTPKCPHPPVTPKCPPPVACPVRHLTTHVPQFSKPLKEIKPFN